MKKLILATAVAMALPFATLVQAADTDAPKSTAKPKRQVNRSAAKAVEEVTPVTQEVDPELSEADLAVARRVHVGRAECELGADVSVQIDDKKPGFFIVYNQKHKFRMHPVESRTGAIRLEDPGQGAVWLQLGNKSMLMNQKLGLRIADDCKTPDQVAFGEDMKKHPLMSLFEGADAPVAEKYVEPAPVKPAAGAKKSATPATTKK
jgi:hypothetical protein